MPNILGFKTPNESGFLVFSVSNAKYLAFDTPNGNAPLLTGHDTFLAYSPNLFSFLTALKLMAPSHQFFFFFLMAPIIYTKWKKTTCKKLFIILMQHKIP